MTPLEQLARRHPRGLGPSMHSAGRQPTSPVQASPAPQAVHDLSPVPFAWASETLEPGRPDPNEPIPRGPTTSEATSSTPASFPSDAPTRGRPRGIGDVSPGTAAAASGGLGFLGGLLIGSVIGAAVVAVAWKYTEEEERYRAAGYSGR